NMHSALKHTLIAIAMAALGVTAGCKSNGSYREQQKTAGEEVEARDEHGDTATDDANSADEYQSESK
ncbi:MAG: hypothetical protein WCE62_00370, partial [Polyangiales bacterium]